MGFLPIIDPIIPRNMGNPLCFWVCNPNFWDKSDQLWVRNPYFLPIIGTLLGDHWVTHPYPKLS